MIELEKSDGTIISLRDDVNYWWVNQKGIFKKGKKTIIRSCTESNK